MLFGEMTVNRLPDKLTGFTYKLGVMLDSGRLPARLRLIEKKPVP